MPRQALSVFCGEDTAIRPKSKETNGRCRSLDRESHSRVRDVTHSLGDRTSGHIGEVATQVLPGG